MKLSLGFLVSEILLFVSAGLAWSAAGQKTAAHLPSVDRKLQHIEVNAQRRHPDPTPTVFTEQEINAYLASNEVALPDGVQSVKLEEHPKTITGRARVDFDRLRAGMGTSSPLFAIFSGVHDVVVATHAYAVGGQAYLHVDSVSLDGVEIPRFVLERFVEKYLRPKDPDIGLDSRFALPDRIDTATVGEHTITLIQK